MKTAKLKIGFVYNYTSPVERVQVKYTGWSHCPSVGWGYGFKAYNEETGKFDGSFTTLSRMSVENLINEP